MTRQSQRSWKLAVLLPLAFLPARHHRNAHSRAARSIAPVRVGAFSTRPQSEALIQAVSDEKLAEVKHLLKIGISPNAVDDPKASEGKSALQIAAETGNVQIVRLLLDNGYQAPLSQQFFSGYFIGKRGVDCRKTEREKGHMD